MNAFTLGDGAGVESRVVARFPDSPSFPSVLIAFSIVRATVAEWNPDFTGAHTCSNCCCAVSPQTAKAAFARLMAGDRSWIDGNLDHPAVIRIGVSYWPATSSRPASYWLCVDSRVRRSPGLISACA
ncbi:hypothetical protein ACQPZ2_19925 [Nocardia pseudovaccinii]|uniref:hypothetical protein n=1 Tax=Nocardia pseudovaccinii TaxID=189540 RepID=UPI003D8A41AA